MGFYQKHKFTILIVLIWVLNLIDAIQTYYYHKCGYLYEVNYILQTLINHDVQYMFICKFVGLIIITAWLLRGWNEDAKSEENFSRWVLLRPLNSRRAILRLLLCGIIYYLVVVTIPLI